MARFRRVPIGEAKPAAPFPEKIDIAVQHRNNLILGTVAPEQKSFCTSSINKPFLHRTAFLPYLPPAIKCQKSLAALPLLDQPSAIRETRSDELIGRTSSNGERRREAAERAAAVAISQRKGRLLPPLS
jgi:hypothetical protein